MTVTTSPFFGINYGWATGQAGWGDPVNSNFKVLSFLGKGAVDSFVGTLPVSPSEGASVVLTTDNQFYVRLEGVWLFIEPQEGQEVNEIATGKRWQFNGSWVEIASTEALKARVEDLEQFDTDLTDATTTPNGAGKVGYSYRQLVTHLDEVPHLTDYWRTGDGSDWQPAFARIVTAGHLSCLAPKGNYGLGSTVFLPAGFWVYGESRNVTFFPLATATSLTSGFLFMINTNDGINWITPFPNMNTGGFSTCQFDNRNSVPALRGIKCFGSGKFEQLSFSGYRQSISRPTGFYCDSFQLRDIICQNPQDNTEYQIDIQGLGDGFTAHDIHCPYTVATTSSVLAMRVRGVNGGTVSEGIGGDYLIELSNDVNIVGGHFERAQHIYDSSNVKVTSQFNPDTRLPILTKGTFASASNESRFLVDLDNTTFRNIEGLMEWTGFHVSQGDSVELSVNNCAQVWSAQGDFQRVQRAGIRICREDQATAIPSFNNYSYLTSKQSVVEIPNIVNLDHGTRCADTSFVGISSIRVEPVGTRNVGTDQWKIATGTYYYQAQILFDAGRAIGRNPTNAETSATAVLGSMIINNVGFGTNPRSAIIRLYRGTSSGSYDSFVDIHTLGTTWLHDNGLSVNGVAWQSRTPAAINTINSAGSYLKLLGSLIEVTATASFGNAGSFTQGDLVKRTDATIDANSMLLIGHYRLTTGSGGVEGTDWSNMRVSRVSPAV